MNEGMKTIIYPVKDIAKAKAWFGTLLGAKPTVDKPFYVHFEIGDLKIGLNPNGHAQGSTGALCYWNVADIEKSLKELTDAGAQAVQAPEDVGGGKLVATVKDADGNVFGLIQAT
jgi:predicted enzyme related to lactoylglutathione lyase